MSKVRKCAVQGCKAYRIMGDDKCFQHSELPDVVAKRATARRKGGKRAKSTVMTAADVRDLLAKAFRLRLAGKIEARDLEALNVTARLALAAIRADKNAGSKGAEKSQESEEEKRERVLAEIDASYIRYTKKDGEKDATPDKPPKPPKPLYLGSPDKLEKHEPRNREMAPDKNVHGKPGEFCGCAECNERRKTEAAIEKLMSSSGIIAVKTS